MLLFSLLFISFISFCHVFFINRQNILLIKKLALLYSGVVFLISLIAVTFFDAGSNYLQFALSFDWIPFYNYVTTIGLDGLSLFFVILSTLLIFLCVLGSWNNVKKLTKEYFICFLVLNFLLILVFSITDVFLFYIFFESTLIPMFLIIGVWGSRERKIRAVYLFFFFTLIGSLFMLLAILYLYNKAGTTNYEILLNLDLTNVEQRWLWLAFFLSFATKMPLFPLHVWLPEAHVEAPTAGSVLLAGILLKLGSYGFLRFTLAFFPDACIYFAPLIFTLSILGIIFTSFTAMRQTDFKRIIAYSSVAHMNLVMLGIFSFHLPGLEGSVIQSLSHGFVASALFFLIGVLYDRYHTRLLLYFGGVVQVMPIYIIFFLFFTMANIALPGTSSFIGEFLILSGIYSFNTTATFLGTTGMILGGAYSLWLFNRIAYGNLKTQYMTGFSDLSLREIFIFLPLILGTLLLGLLPNSILYFLHPWSFGILMPYIL